MKTSGKGKLMVKKGVLDRFKPRHRGEACVYMNVHGECLRLPNHTKPTPEFCGKCPFYEPEEHPISRKILWEITEKRWWLRSLVEAKAPQDVIHRLLDEIFRLEALFDVVNRAEWEGEEIEEV